VRSRLLAGVLLATLAAGRPSSAVTLNPILRLSAMGGQYFTGATDSSGVNVDAMVVPVIGINPRLYVIPIYLASYHETQSVYSFLGERTLINKQLDQTGVVRLAWSPSSAWRLKPRAGYKREWIQQNTDGSLSDGLFNYGRLFTGASAERVLANGSIEVGYEYGFTRFPNYQSLDADPRLTTTGITAGAGTKVLDFNSHETSLSYQTSTADRRRSWDVTLTWLRENFRDQKVITSTEGGFEDFVDERRMDDIMNGTLNHVFRPSARWTFASAETLQYYHSNQNAFDATQLYASPFTFRYYNFVDLQWSPSVSRFWGEGRWETTVTGSLGYRKYDHRRAQDGEGTYLSELIHSTNRGGTLTVRYRVLKGLFAVMTGSLLRYESNTRYEANYPYNYTVASYLGGLSWEY
jgi:hypothetical protein